MFERNLAHKLEGWNTISDIAGKLKVKKGTAYVYVNKLDKKDFVIQKIKRPRGTMYLINPIPVLLENRGMLDDTDLVHSELEFSKKEIPSEHKIAFFLKESKERNNARYEEEARKSLRSIKNWKRMYRYLKAYGVVGEFKALYEGSLGKVKKLPSMPKRYKRLIGV